MMFYADQASHVEHTYEVDCVAIALPKKGRYLRPVALLDDGSILMYCSHTKRWGATRRESWDYSIREGRTEIRGKLKIRNTARLHPDVIARIESGELKL